MKYWVITRNVCMSTEQTNQPPSEYAPMEIDDFSIITDVVHSLVTKVEHHLNSSDQPEVDLKETPHQRIMPTRIDPGRKVFSTILIMSRMYIT